jgi:hypothetical protein
MKDIAIIRREPTGADLNALLPPTGPFTRTSLLALATGGDIMPQALTRLPQPPTIDDKAFAAVDGEWRTSRKIFAIVDDGAHTTLKVALIRLADAGKIERRYEPYRNGKIAMYRRRVGAFKEA